MLVAFQWEKLNFTSVRSFKGQIEAELFLIESCNYYNYNYSGKLNNRVGDF